MLIGDTTPMAAEIQRLTRRTRTDRAREVALNLLQHAHNPVIGIRGRRAFANARRENKPIFLSIVIHLSLVPRDGTRVVRERREAAIMNREL